MGIFGRKYNHPQGINAPTLLVWGMLVLCGTMEIRGAELSPAFLGAWPGRPSGIPQDMALHDSLVFLANGKAGLQIINVAAPSQPIFSGSFTLFGTTTALTVNGSYVYISDDLGLHAIRVNVPSVPVWEAALTGLPKVHRMATHGQVLCLATSDGLQLVDISNPQTLRRLGDFAVDTSAGVRHIAIVPDHALLSVPGEGLHLVNIQNPLAPMPVGLVPGTSENCHEIAAQDSVAYFCAGREGLKILSIQDPSSPQIMANYRPFNEGIPDSVQHIVLAGNHAYVGTESGQLHILDVSNPAQPAVVTNLPVNSFGKLASYGNTLQMLRSEPNPFIGLETFSIESPSTPVSLARLPTAHVLNQMVVSGNMVCVADDAYGVHFLSLTNLYESIRLGGLELPPLHCLETMHHQLYVSVIDEPGLKIWDVSKPANPVSIPCSIVQSVQALAVDYSQPAVYAFLEEPEGTVEMLDVTDPDNPSTKGHITNCQKLLQVVVRDSIVYGLTCTTNQGLELKILEQAGSDRLNQLGVYHLPDLSEVPGREHYGIAMRGSMIYLAGPWGLDVVDVSNPTNPQRIGRMGSFGPNQLAISDQFAFIADQRNGLHIIDISDPALPRFTGLYPAGSDSNCCADIALTGNTLLMAYGTEGLLILDTGEEPNQLPRILVQPTDQRIIRKGDTAEFIVEAQGSLPLFFQWRFGDSEIPGAWQSQLTLTNVQPEQVGNYSVNIRNGSGFITSSNVSLALNQPPTITISDPKPFSALLTPGTTLVKAEAMDQDGTISQVEFYDRSILLGSVNGPPYQWLWFHETNGLHSLIARAKDNEGVWDQSMTIPVTTTNLPVFQFQKATYSAQESNRMALVTVRRNADSAARIQIHTTDGSARSLQLGGFGQFEAVQQWLEFAEGEREKTVSIPLVDDLVYRERPWFVVRLDSPNPPWGMSFPSETVVTIIDNDPPWTTNSLTDVKPPAPLTTARGSLQVFLEPMEASGKWRFPWERSWRASGAIADNLVPGNYPVVFLPRAGFEIPPSTVLVVLDDSLESVTHYYSVRQAPLLGTLQVSLYPSGLAQAEDSEYRGQWKLESDPATQWHDSGAIRDNLPVGQHMIHWKPVTGFATPPMQTVDIQADEISLAQATYLLVPEVIGVEPVPLIDFSIMTNGLEEGFPYAFNGQLVTELGYGSGFVVKRRTVLTAAHVVFNPHTLTFADQVQWFFQKHRNDHQAPPQIPRGWFVFSGYAAQRTNDLVVQGLNPGEMSTATRSLDVAALYFFEDAGRGGYGGYLISDPAQREWLLEPSPKLLLGYPMEGVPTSQAGLLHQTGPDYFAFEKVSNQLYRSFDLKSYPGMSGGAVYVENSNDEINNFSPTGIILGSKNQTVIRGIDFDIIQLITKGEVTAGKFKTPRQAGLLTIHNNASEGSTADSTFQIRIHPPRALTEGADWRFQNETNYSEYPDLHRSIPASTREMRIQFKAIPGWSLPINRSVVVSPGATTYIDVEYPFSPLQIDHTRGVTLSGATGNTFVVEYADQLNLANPWNLLGSITLTNTTQTVAEPMPNQSASQGRARFYRVVSEPSIIP